MNIHKILKHTEKFVGDNSPAILTGLGVAGTVATAALTAKASFKAYERLQGETLRQNESLNLNDLTVKDRFKLVWKLYIPPVLTGCVTITSIVFANRIGTRRAATMAAAYTLSERAYSEYREKIVEKLGEKKESDAKQEIAQKRVETDPPKDVYVTGEGEVLFLDVFGGRYFKSTMEDVKKAQNDTNYEVLNFGYASLNEFYQRLGLPHTQSGEEFGWTSEDKLELEFSSALTADQKPCITFEFVKLPIRGYHKFG